MDLAPVKAAGSRRRLEELQEERMDDRTMKVGVLAVLTLVGACGDGEGGDGLAGDPFCGPALAQVDSFISERAAAAGGAGAETSPETSAGTSMYGGTAVVSGSGEIASGMNALVSSDYTAAQHQSFVNLMTLIQYDESLRPVPYLAESWEIDADTSHVTFHLRDDVFWHDGVKTTAEDVAFTYERMTDPATAFPNPAFWDFYVKGPEGVEVVDSFTVRIALERPHAEFMDPWRSSAIMPEHLLADVPPAELAQHPFGTRCPVGNGPFVFTEHRPQESWTFRANPAFPEGLGGRPYLDRYVYRIISEPTTQLTELLNGRTDIYISPPASQAEAIREAEGVELRNYLFRDYVYVGWNARVEELSDPRVRRALTMGTNRQEIVDAILEGYGRVAQTSVPPFHWAYDPAFEDAITYDPEGARRLLEEAGWTDRDGDGIRENADGEPLEVSIKYNEGNQQRQNVAEIMQAQLREVGVRITPRVVEWTTLLEQLTDPEQRDFEGVVMGWVTEFKLDDRDLFHSARIDEPYAFSGTNNPRIDQMLDTLQLVTDRDEAKELWSEYQRILIEEQPYTFFFFKERLDGVSERLDGVEMDVRGEWISAREWRIDPSAERR